MTGWQVIFQVNAKGKWLDYCREPTLHKDFNMVQRWALEQCDMLEKREPGLFRAKYEFWN